MNIEVVAKSGNRYIIVIDGDRWAARVVIVRGSEVHWVSSCMPVGSHVKMGYWYDVSANEALNVKEAIEESLKNA